MVQPEASFLLLYAFNRSNNFGLTGLQWEIYPIMLLQATRSAWHTLGSPHIFLPPLLSSEGYFLVEFVKMKKKKISVQLKCFNQSLSFSVPVNGDILLLEINADSSYFSLRNEFCPVAQSNPTICNPMNCNMPGFPIPHQLLELTQTHVH